MTSTAYDVTQRKSSYNDISINNTVYSNLSSDDDFLLQSNIHSNNLSNKKYNLIFQQDFLNRNNLEINSKINSDVLGTINIIDSVRFSEITFPLIGLNLLPDESKQSFVGVNLFDLLLMQYRNPNEFNELFSTSISYFIAFDDMFEKLIILFKRIFIHKRENK